MDRQAQHRHNAGLEKRWIDDAARDERDLLVASERERHQGNVVEANFLAQEARNAGSWIGKRERIVSREKRLGGKK